MSQCYPIQTSITENNKLMLTIETPIFENDYASKFNLIMKTGKNFFLSYVSVTETNKIKIILEENN